MERHSLADDVLSHFRYLTPLLLWEVKAASHDFFAHVFRDGAAVVFGVKRRISAEHYIDDHPQGPQITALKSGREKQARKNVSALQNKNHSRKKYIYSMLKMCTYFVCPKVLITAQIEGKNKLTVMHRHQNV